MANYLSAVGMHAEAREYYKYILMQYQSANCTTISVCLFLEAFELF